MVNINEIGNNVRLCLSAFLDMVSKKAPVIGFMKPLVVRALNCNIDDIKKYASMIADKEGNIDLDTILNEMIDNAVNIEPFTMNVKFIGDVRIGGGGIHLGIPFTNGYEISLNKEDLLDLKNSLINKN